MVVVMLGSEGTEDQQLTSPNIKCRSIGAAAIREKLIVYEM